MVIEASKDEKRSMVTAFDPLKGRGKVLRTIEKDPADDYQPTGLSPDGSTLAIPRGGEAQAHIRLISLSGGSDREIAVKGWPTSQVLTGPLTARGFTAALSRHKAEHFSTSI